MRKTPDKIVEALCQDYKSGLSMAQVATIHGVSAQTVHNHLHARDVEIRTPHISDSTTRDICRDYQLGLPMYHLAQKYHRGHATIRSILDKRGVIIKPYNPRVPDNVAQIVYQEYQQGKSSIILATKYNLSHSTILRCVRRCGGTVRRTGNAYYTYHCNSHYFDSLNSATKAYWVGFIAADGCIIDEMSRSKLLQIGLQLADKDHIARFLSHLESNHPIHEYGNAARVSISNEHLCNSLAQYNIVPCKSTTMQFPDIPEVVLSHYMRGCMDGDGSWYVPYSDRIYKKRYMYPNMQFCSGSLGFLEVFQHHLMQHCQLNKTKVSLQSAHGYRFCYDGRQQLQRIVQFLYHNAIVYMPRKWAKAQQILYHTVDSPLELPPPIDIHQLPLL